MAYGTRFAQLRDSHSMRNKDLAEIVGVSEATISRYLSDGTDIPLEIATKLAQAFDTSLDEIVGIGQPAAHPRVMHVPAEIWQAHERQHERQIHTKNIALTIMGVALSAVMIFLMVFIALDLLNGNVGWVRYAANVEHRAAQVVMRLLGLGS